MNKNTSIIYRKLLNAYVRHFGQVDEKDVRLFFSPGRINLIGEHIDYNGGNVFPAAIEIGTYGLIVKRNDTLVRAISINFEKFGVSEGDLANITKKGGKFWLDYILGVANEFKKNNYKVDIGFNMIMFGNIPNSSGLSSSASIEVLSAMIFNFLNNLGLDSEEDRVKIAKMAQAAENNFVGVNCGIMDQFAIAMGKEDKAIYLNTATLKYEYVPFDLKDYRIVIISTNKKRALITSKYGERREQCEKVVDTINRIGLFNCNALAELDLNMLERIKPYVVETLFKRARHVVTENIRTIEAKKALIAGDLQKVGKLLNASHISLRDDYEVTGIELDTIFDVAQNFKGCLGARMTGAGFGGCAIAIVHENAINDFARYVGQKYREIIGYDCVFYLSKAYKGAHQIL
jgi:galactokinase